MRRNQAHRPRRGRSRFWEAGRRLPYPGLSLVLAYGIKPILAVLLVWLFVVALSLLGSGPEASPGWWPADGGWR